MLTNLEDLLWAAFGKADNCFVDREMDVIDTGGHFESFRMSQVVEHLRELLTVRSVEELDALPDDTAVLVDDCPARKHLGDWYFANDDGAGYGSESLALYLPALVLYRPDGDTP